MKINILFLASLATASLLMAQSSGKVLYNKQCASCHGLSAQTKALGTSKILNTLSEDEIIAALVGYKNGTYGGKLKSVKRGLVSTLSENDISSLAVYIQILKP